MFQKNTSFGQCTCREKFSNLSSISTLFLQINEREFTWLLNVTFFQGLSFVACESQLQIKKMEIKTVKIVKNYRYKSLSVGS